MGELNWTLEEVKHALAVHRLGGGAAIERAQTRIRELEAPIQDFIDKVESGRARSKDSYAKFKAVMEGRTSE